ncbi:Dcp2, box A domain-domain-containing protein [Catenaria anguillulae PL171]|uniref:Dcp2, box A domain-domain-containing protein n=1 Tax=Catenaria anguillulae PL171 TaxID=765915 RepID=A0A1Y2HUC6_9FUNG|nr:Dcp2, box A domain-domain-containing protein [Catenaria anguillulae PL171]
MTFANLSLSEVLDDLGSRFIINVPDEELASIERICFQIEQAHWFYEDFVREENPTLPSFSLKAFCAQFFHHCPLLHEWAEVHEQAFATFMKYKFRVPVCGAIILNHTYDHVLLVKGWNSRTWSWPRGKINKGEKELRCAVREVMEETGFDITPYLSGPSDKEINEPDHMQITIKEQRLRLYIAAGVPTSTTFETRTRKEIAEIAWHPLASLPGFSKRAAGNGGGVGGNVSDAIGGHYSSSAAGGSKKKTWVKKRKQYLKRNGPPAKLGGTPVLDVDSEYDTDRSASIRMPTPASTGAAAVMPTTASLELKSILGIGGGGGGGVGRSATVESISAPSTPPPAMFVTQGPLPTASDSLMVNTASDVSPSFSHLLSATTATSSHLRDLLGILPGSPPPASNSFAVPGPVDPPVSALSAQPAPVRIWQPKPAPPMFPAIAAAATMPPRPAPLSSLPASGNADKAQSLLSAILLGPSVPAPAPAPAPAATRAASPPQSHVQARSPSPLSPSSASVRSRSASPSSSSSSEREVVDEEEKKGGEEQLPQHPWVAFKFDRSKIVACFD